MLFFFIIIFLLQEYVSMHRAILVDSHFFHLACPPQTYGENCAKSCACGIGASHCDVIRGCVCKSGWSGERCDQDIDECQTVQTQAECLAQSARCVNSQGGYACRCAPGFTKNASNSCEGELCAVFIIIILIMIKTDSDLLYFEHLITLKKDTHWLFLRKS